MAVTSVAIPFAAVWHRMRGALRWRRATPWVAPRPKAIVFDRDGTLIENVPYNGDPDLVRPVENARSALDRLRGAGLATAVVTNQAGVGRGLLAADDVRRVNGRVEELLGPLGPWFVCPHAPEDACSCRKPEPEMIRRAAASLGLAPHECVMIGDTAADVEAAVRAGAKAILVPNNETRAEELRRAPCVASSLSEAIDLVVEGAV